MIFPKDDFKYVRGDVGACVRCCFDDHDRCVASNLFRMMFFPCQGLGSGYFRPVTPEGHAIAARIRLGVPVE